MARRGAKPGEFEEPKQERTRQQLKRIVEEADRLFAERGYGGTKVADIAEAVPCSISTIYDRFGGKADLLRYMHQGGVEDAIESIGDMEIEDVAGSGLDAAVPLAVRTGLAMIRRFRGRRRAAAERVHADDELAELESQLDDTLTRAGQQFLLTYSNEIEHPQPELAAMFAMRLMMAMVEKRESLLPTPMRDDVDDEIFEREVSRMVLRYLRASDPN